LLGANPLSLSLFLSLSLSLSRVRFFSRAAPDPFLTRRCHGRPFRLPCKVGLLCTASGIATGSVTLKVCTNTPDTCEVYIKKGNENGVSNIQTCRQYCQAHGMTCTAQYDDNNSCSRGKKYVYVLFTVLGSIRGLR